MIRQFNNHQTFWSMIILLFVVYNGWQFQHLASLKEPVEEIKTEAYQAPITPVSTVSEESAVSGFPHPVKLQAIAADLDYNQVRWLAINNYAETLRTGLTEDQYREQMTHISWVVRNRKESSNYPTTYRSVLTQRRQFSWYNGNARVRIPAHGRVSSRRYYQGFAWDGSNVFFEHGNPVGRQWEIALETALSVMVAPEADRPFPADWFGYYHIGGLTVRGPMGNAHARSGCNRLGGEPHPAWRHGRPGITLHNDLVITPGA